MRIYITKFNFTQHKIHYWKAMSEFSLILFKKRTKQHPENFVEPPYTDIIAQRKCRKLNPAFLASLKHFYIHWQLSEPAYKHILLKFYLKNTYHDRA